MMSSILWPMLAQIFWTFLLYAWLTFARTRAVWRGEVDYSCFELGREEPRAIARITRNLANQVAVDRVSTIDLVAAWIFVAGRVIHTLVQTLTDKVELRGRVFMINFLAVVVLVGHVVLLAVEGVGVR
jgi:hypothetical protein